MVHVGSWWTTGLLTASGLKALIMPAITLALFQMTLIMRLVRAEMLEVLRADYIRFARARGLSERKVHFRHALKNTLVPVITVVGLQLGSIVAFSIITETVFSWPGMGQLFLQSVQNVDIPIMAAYLLFIAFLFVIINLVVDLLYAAVDPRLRAAIHGAEAKMSEITVELPKPEPKSGSFFERLKDSDLVASFLSSKVTVLAGALTLIFFLAAILAPLIAPTNPFDPASNFLIDSLNPPRFVAGGDPRFLLGTDDQGRDLWSAILYGLRVSLLIGVFGVLLGGAIGITLGLIAGYAGGRIDFDHHAHRRCAAHLSGDPHRAAASTAWRKRFCKGQNREETAFGVLVVSIGLSFWVQYARTVRGSTLVEKNRDYVQAARLIGLSPARILARHILPNVMGPVLVIATINLALAIITEATLSFLGVGLPPTQPSLGTLIRIGQNFLFSGEWWIVTFPSITLATLVLAVNLLGDWLRDALNPRLK